MCVFCAAIPVTAAVGANKNAAQKAKRRATEEQGRVPPAEKPIAKLTLGAIVLLTICAIVYHTLLGPLWKL
jgi:hypothetical protein